MTCVVWARRILGNSDNSITTRKSQTYFGSVALCDSKQNNKTYRQALEGLHGVCRLCPCHAISDLAAQVIITMRIICASTSLIERTLVDRILRGYKETSRWVRYINYFTAFPAKKCRSRPAFIIQIELCMCECILHELTGNAENHR